MVSLWADRHAYAHHRGGACDPLSRPPRTHPPTTIFSNQNQQTIKTSTMGTLNMLGLAKRVRARMLLTSTSEVRSVVLSPSYD